ncbi:pyridoxamine 5'-phosphate oxidase family protein [Cognatishimia sp. WU-CL00825]|uniref:pyridoxamine 5'-phosphate oxidase family protein n=1 Tax=Cognatishimia sp. WU-CL00825 TaxID=3127658 RepID=UPI0033654251
MQYLKTVEDLETLYPEPSVNATRKVARSLTPAYRKWIMTSRYCVLSTVGPDGTDASPRGNHGPVVSALDDQTLAMPDWPGNNRIDTLRNIVQDPRIALMFMIPGQGLVVRVNGQARVTTDTPLRQQFEHKGKTPRSVIVIKINEIYSHCSRATLRSDLWNPDNRPTTAPSMGELLAEATQGEVDAASYNQDWEIRGPKLLW